MRHGRAFATTLGLVAVLMVFGPAPAAHASAPNIEVAASTFAANAPVGAKVTVTLPGTGEIALVETAWPRNSFTALFSWSYGACPPEIQIRVDGTLLSAAAVDCLLNPSPSAPYGPALTFLFNSPYPQAGSRIEITWGDGLLTSGSTPGPWSVDTYVNVIDNGTQGYGGSATTSLLPAPPSPPAATSTDLMAWEQAYQRAGRDDACERGWSPSWQQWPNAGQGGWVCARSVRAFGGGTG